MIVSHAYRRALLLSIVVILVVSMLAVGSLLFLHSTAHAQIPRGVQHSAARLDSSHNALSQNSTSRHSTAKTADNCSAVPSWDITQHHLAANGQYGLVRVYINWEMHVMS